MAHLFQADYLTFYLIKTIQARKTNQQTRNLETNPFYLHIPLPFCKSGTGVSSSIWSSTSLSSTSLGTDLTNYPSPSLTCFPISSSTYIPPSRGKHSQVCPVETKLSIGPDRLWGTILSTSSHLKSWNTVYFHSVLFITLSYGIHYDTWMHFETDGYFLSYFTDHSAIHASIHIHLYLQPKISPRSTSSCISFLSSEETPTRSLLRFLTGPLAFTVFPLIVYNASRLQIWSCLCYLHHPRTCSYLLDKVYNHKYRWLVGMSGGRGFLTKKVAILPRFIFSIECGYYFLCLC